MITLLQINTSINNGNGQSSQLARQFVEAFRKHNPKTKIVARDVAAAEPVPHLDADRFGAFIAKPEERSAAQRAVVAYSDTLIHELQQADVIVLGLPMYNFGVPSQLKAYFDHVARAGVTFKYTDQCRWACSLASARTCSQPAEAFMPARRWTRKPATCATSCAL